MTTGQQLGSIARYLEDWEQGAHQIMPACHNGAMKALVLREDGCLVLQCAVCSEIVVVVMLASRPLEQ